MTKQSAFFWDRGGKTVSRIDIDPNNKSQTGGYAGLQSRLNSGLELATAEDYNRQILKNSVFKNIIIPSQQRRLGSEFKDILGTAFSMGGGDPRATGFNDAIINASQGTEFRKWLSDRGINLGAYEGGSGLTREQIYSPGVLDTKQPGVQLSQAEVDRIKREGPQRFTEQTGGFNPAGNPLQPKPKTEFQSYDPKTGVTTTGEPPAPDTPITPAGKEDTGWYDEVTGKSTPVGVGTPRPKNEKITADNINADTGDITAQSEKMNEMTDKAIQAYEKVGGDANIAGPGGDAFIQTVAQARFGRKVTEEELQALRGTTTGRVVEFFGMADKMPNAGLVSKAEEGKSKEQTIKDLQAKVNAGGKLSPDDEANWEYATGGASLPVVKVEEAPDFNAGDGGVSGEANAAANAAGSDPNRLGEKSALDKMTDLVDNFMANKGAARDEANIDEGVAGKQEALNEAQKIADDYQTKIDQMQTDLNLQDILNEETKLALEGKIKGEAIPMSIINRQLTKDINNLSQKQRLDRLYDVYSLNTQINAYNAQIRNVNLLNGQYKDAKENIQNTIDDWTEWQGLKLDILQEQGKLESEERDRLQKEIDYERGLAEQGMVHIDNRKTRDKLVNELGVTAATYSQYFMKDPVSGKIYLKPDSGPNATVDAYVNQIKNGNIKLANVPINLRNKVAKEINIGKNTTNNTTPILPSPNNYKEGDLMSFGGKSYIKTVEGVWKEINKTSSDELTIEEKNFKKDLDKEKEKLQRGGKWGKSWNFLKNKYNPTNEELDAMLNKNKYYKN